MIIPRMLVNLKGGANESTTNHQKRAISDKMIANAYDYLGSIRKTAKVLGIARETVRRVIDNMENEDKPKEIALDAPITA